MKPIRHSLSDASLPHLPVTPQSASPNGNTIVTHRSSCLWLATVPKSRHPRAHTDGRRLEHDCVGDIHSRGFRALCIQSLQRGHASFRWDGLGIAAEKEHSASLSFQYALYAATGVEDCDYDQGPSFAHVRPPEESGRRTSRTASRLPDRRRIRALNNLCILQTGGYEFGRAARHTAIRHASPACI